MLMCDDPQTAFPCKVRLVGLKPPWNHPHVTPAAFKRSPIFCPFIAIVVLAEQSSYVGSASPMTVPFAETPGRLAGVAPAVLPETKFSAPGVDGPNVVPKELSFKAKF